MCTRKRKNLPVLSFEMGSYRWLRKELDKYLSMGKPFVVTNPRMKPRFKEWLRKCIPLSYAIGELRFFYGVCLIFQITPNDCFECGELGYFRKNDVFPPCNMSAEEVFE